MRKHALATLRPCLTSTLLVVVVILLPGAASAQTDPSNTLGLQQGRNYFSPESFEHLDTATTNLVLRFVDLSLPGNAGRALQFQRTFNNTRPVFGSPVHSRWSFGFPGMVMWILEKSEPSINIAFDDNLQSLINYSPALVMADGGIQPTVFVQRPVKPSGQAWEQATMQWVRSGQLYEYDRATRTLYMPDGTICHYAPTATSNLLALTAFEDPFGNQVTLTRDTSTITVTQHLGNGQSRIVTLGIDGGGRVESMSYDGRQWTYAYTTTWPDGMRDITAVTPPLGSGWTFAYEPSGLIDLTEITTPNGGRIAYAWERVVVDAAYHQTITNAFRSLWPYGSAPPSTQQLQNILRTVYQKFPLP